MTPSMSRPRSVMSLRSRRTSRMSESVSTKIFISRSCRWEEQTPLNSSTIFTSAKQLLKQQYLVMIALFHSIIFQKERKKNNILPYLKERFVRKRHNSFKYDYTGTIHIFLHKEEGKSESKLPQFNFYKIKAAECHYFV